MGTNSVHAVRGAVREWLVAADDRTGAFEVAALFAQVVGPVTVTVGDAPSDSGVVDLGSRSMSSRDVERVAGAIEKSRSAWTAHKIDSTLRGNWVAELRVRHRASGRRVVVLPGWPEMGRTCVRGVVHVDGVPIGDVRHHIGDADLVANASELSAWLAGTGRIVVCDVPNSEAMHAAASVLVGHNVLLAGPAGPLGAAFAADRQPRPTSGAIAIERPTLVICGSANPISREQVLRLSDVEVISTDSPNGELDPQAVLALAARAKLRIGQIKPRTVVIIGGETAAAVLGDSPRTVIGISAPGMPCSIDGDGPVVITKAGGFGGPDALVELLRGENG